MNRKYKDYSEKDIREAVKTSFSLAEVLRKLGLRSVGGNYRTIKNNIIKYNIDTSHFTGKGWNKYGHPSFGNSGMPLPAVLDRGSSLSSALPQPD